MIEYPHSRPNFFSHSRARRSIAVICGPISATSFSRKLPLGVACFGAVLPDGKYPETNESKRREAMVDGRARRQRTSCLEATFEPFAGTRVCHE